MSHERSETVKRKDGRWVNVYGRDLPKAGQQLPNSKDYSTVEEAVDAAGTRSKMFDHAETDAATKADTKDQLDNIRKDNQDGWQKQLTGEH